MRIFIALCEDLKYFTKSRYAIPRCANSRNARNPCISKIKENMYLHLGLYFQGRGETGSSSPSYDTNYYCLLKRLTGYLELFFTSSLAFFIWLSVIVNANFSHCFQTKLSKLKILGFRVFIKITMFLESI